MNIEELKSARTRGERPSAPSADLEGANLWGANLWGANLRGANHILQLRGMPSGELILWPTPGGWSLVVGCWGGSVEDLRTLIVKDADWPEATAEQIPERRAYLEAALTLCDLHTTKHADVIPALAEKWGYTP